MHSQFARVFDWLFVHERARAIKILTSMSHKSSQLTLNRLELKGFGLVVVVLVWLLLFWFGCCCFGLVSF